MINLKRKYIKVFLLTILLINVKIIFSQNAHIALYSSSSNWNNIALDFTKNRFCYFGIDAYVAGTPYCKGNFIKSNDTIVLKSDYDNMNLPLTVAGEILDTTNYCRLIFNFITLDSNRLEEKAYKLIKKTLFLIINGSDTISLEKDTIAFTGSIRNFYISRIENNMSIFNTKKYVNSKFNEFNIYFYYQIDYELYKSVNGVLILNKNSALFYPDNINSVENFKSITIKKMNQVFNTTSCQCFYENGSLNFNQVPFK